MKLLQFFPLAVLLMVFVACSDDDNDAEPGIHEITMTANTFVPAELTVSAGSTVTWENTSSVLHTVTSEDGLFDEELPPDATFSFVFDVPGTYDYVCTLHPGMEGTIIVE